MSTCMLLILSNQKDTEKAIKRNKKNVFVKTQYQLFSI